MKSLFKVIIFTAMIFASAQSLAALKIISVGGVSNQDVDLNGNITAIYGGIAGTCTGFDNISTCNSCINTAPGPSIQACNQQSVYGNLPITITFSSDKTLNNAKLQITTDLGNTAGSEAPFFIDTRVTEVTPGNPITVSVPWSYLCDHDDNFSATCDPSSVSPELNFFAARKIYLKVDQDADEGTDDEGEIFPLSVFLHYVKADDNTMTQQTFCTSSDDPVAATALGMCGFKLAVGDEKLVLEEVYGSNSGGTPAQNSGAPAWMGVALIAVPAAITTISNSSRPLEVRSYTSSFFIKDNSVTGLENYVNHCLLMGNINKAKNIYKFNILSTNPADVCAAPSEVVGILSDKSCFISTAAFGSDMAGQVQLLRKFRNQYLAPYSVGRAMIKFYYHVSPAIAGIIEQSEFLKAVTRTILYPVVGIAWFALNYGYLLVVLIIGAILFALKKQKVERDV